MAYHMSELSRSLKPFGYPPQGEGHTTSISYVSDVIHDSINFDPSVRIDELLKNGKHFQAIRNTMYSYKAEVFIAN